MKVDECTIDVRASVEGDNLPRVGLTSSALPEAQSSARAESSQTGVSTRNVPSANELPTIKRAKNTQHWYALRTTYGREKKAYDYLVSNNVKAFYPTIKTVKNVGAYYPTIKTVKVVDGNRKTIEESRLPNIFFARGTEEEIKSFVYDNVNLPYLRFYYRHIHEGARISKEPLIVPDYQIEGLKIICASQAEDIILELSEIKQFKVGQKVRVVDGIFKGVVGKVARYRGQQRVAIEIDGLLTIASAYVPSAFIEIIR